MDSLARVTRDGTGPAAGCHRAPALGPSESDRDGHCVFKLGLSLTQGRAIVADVFFVAWVGNLIIN